MWPRADGTPDLLERQTEGLAQDVRAELHTCAIARLEPVLDGLPQVIIAHVEIWAARWHRKQLLVIRLVQPNELASGGRHVAGRVVCVEVILLGRRKIREDAWPIALLQHVFAVVGAVDLDSWFHKVHACDAIPANDHGHHDAWIELRSVCAEKGGAVHALPGAVHPMPEVLRVLEILAFVDLFITEEDSLQVQCWQRGSLAQGNSALHKVSSSTWALETAVKDRLRVNTCAVSPPGALKRATSFLMLDLDQSGRSFAIAVVVFPAAIQPRTTSTSCAFHAVPRPMEIDAKVEGSVKNLRVRWLSDEQITTISTHSMCGNACHRLFNCTETGFYHWLRVLTHTPLSQMHTSRRLKIAPKCTIHASGSKTNSSSRIPN